MRMMPLLPAWLLSSAVVLQALGLAEAQEPGTCTAEDHACAAGESTSPDYYWPQQKGDFNRTGLSRYRVPFDLSGGPTWSWQDPAYRVNRFTPLIDDKKNIYIGTVSGKLYKFSPDGEIIWRHDAVTKVPAVPSLMDGSLFYNRGDGVVVALDIETQAVRWETKISNKTGGDTACLFTLDGLVISATEFGNAPPGMATNDGVVALHSGNGSHAWTFKHKWPTFNFQGSSPGDGTMVFQDGAGGLYKLSLKDGSLLWESGIPEQDRGSSNFTTGAAVTGPNGLVYVASNYKGEGIIHAYQLADGKPVWRREMGMPVNQAVAVARLAGSDRLSVVAGIGENPLLPAGFFLSAFLILFDLLACGCCLCACCCRVCCKMSRRSRCCYAMLALLLVVPGQLLLVCAYQILSVSWEAKPGWLFFVRNLPAAMAALDAETGEARWTYTPPPYEKPACESDEALLGTRIYQKFAGDPGDPICLPDNWAQVIVDASGTTYGGHQDGYLYAVRDTDGSGTIDPEKEVSRYFLGGAFQASQAVAPGMLAAVTCSGGLHVWRF